MSGLPTGTVTFLFSDIEGSTRIAQARPDEWPDLLERHRGLLRAAFEAHGGVEVSTEGDSFFVVFSSAGGAAAAATDAQRALHAERWPSDATIRVRMGIHTGEAVIREGTYLGLAVHRAARIAQAAHGGQVLVSATTRALLADALPSGVSLLAVGEHRLRGLDMPESLSQLVVEGLPSEFPTIRGMDATPNNLPIQATTFFGREREIAEVASLLEQTRLLTLTGPGGTGKTRLSLQVAAAMFERYPDGVYFVQLGSINQLELVVPTIAHEVRVPDRGGSRPLERLGEHLRDMTVLLVLDNFEQLLGAAREVAELLAAAPRISILVTSRSPLHVYGEREYPVPPLQVPDPAHLPPLTALSQYESVALFVDRARAAVPSFAVTNDNAPAVAEICYRLDGLPLAIELAAARVKLLSPQAILERLGQSMTFLAGGARDLPARQQTLRGAIQWSYDLLEEEDRRIFAAVSIFVGGADFESIEAICAEPNLNVFESLASLVDKSLVRRSEGVDEQARFSMLDTIREYAGERLRESGREDELRERHAGRYLELAEHAAGVVMGADKRRWLDLLEQEHANLRAAIDWAIEAGRVETAMRLVGALWRFWQMRGYLAEGLDRARAALGMPNADAYPMCRASALDAAGGLAYWMADGPTAKAYYEELLELQRQLGNRAGEAWAHYSLSFTDLYYGSGSSSSSFEFHPGHLAEARQHIEEAIAIYREIGDRVGLAQALWGEANVLWSLGPSLDSPEFDAMLRYSEEARATFRDVGDSFMVGWATYTLALASLRRGDDEVARTHLSEALRIFRDAGDVTGYVLVLDGFAALALRAGDLERAARLASAVAVLEKSTGTGLNPPNRILIGYDPTPLFSDPALATARLEGAEMTTEAVLAYALDEAIPGEATSG